MTPRLSLVARSFSQLSMIIDVPAVAKPVSARRISHQVGSIMMPVNSATMAMREAKTLKARTWPMRLTTFGAKKHPRTKPAAQDVPIRPRMVVGYPSAVPRTGRSSP
ncbi:hypothetical protein D9M70_530620 [compost metagenome]